MPTRILVTGAGGMVGAYVQEALAGAVCVPTSLTNTPRRLDVRDSAGVMACIEREAPDVVVHLAALTDVDRCELEPDGAFETNTIGTRNVAVACQRSDAVLVYVSTGAVFAGDNPKPYIEGDQPRPVNIHGRSKLAGEDIVPMLVARHFVVRTGWLFGGGVKDKKFVRRFAQSLLNDIQPIRAVNDTFGSPTYAKDLILAIAALIHTDAYGLYHIVNGGWCSRYELAVAIRDALGMRAVPIVPVMASDYSLPARRARSEALDSVQLERAGVSPLRPWGVALREYLATELAPVLQGPANAPNGAV